MERRKRKSKKNIYPHAIDLSRLNIKNEPKNKFRELLENIKYRGYEVEQINDGTGRKIIITKPGGKFVFGTVKREDFMVWIYDENENSLWLISHKNIYEDLEEKGKINPAETIKIIDALERVYDGEEPDTVLDDVALTNPYGESPEVLLKAYKWIWGQEDCNYPEGKGRAMSWEGWRKNKKGILEQTGDGIVDLKQKLMKN